ncbi:MAG TPA: lipopolysaccharide biosynthesis protein [Roseiarcus sp.]|jgi:PST family polysaccharide transporter
MSDAAGDPQIGGLRRSALKGAFVTGLAQVVKVAVQFGSVIVLSRLLAPGDFGLLAMVTPIYGLASIFRDLGLSHATVQSSEIGPAQSNALFWLNIAMGLLLAVPLIFGAPIVGWFYGDDRVVGLTRGFAVLIVIMAAGAQQMSLLNRNMRFGFLAGLDAFSALSGFLAAALLAGVFRSYWALFAGMAVSVATGVVGAWIGSDFVPGLPRWDSRVGRMVQLGAGITGYNVFTFIARNLDSVLIGRVWGDASLGLYDRANRFLMFPLLQINAPLARVMLPVLARLRTDGERYRSAYLRAANQLLLVTQPGIVFALACADILIPMLLGEKWRGVVPIFQWMGLAAVVQPFSLTMNWLFISQGKGGAFSWFGAFNAATCTLAFCAGLPWGPIGVAAAYSISQVLLRPPMAFWMATRTGPVRLGDLYGVAAAHGAASAVAFAVIVIVRRSVALDGIPALMSLFCLSYAVSVLVVVLTPSGRTAMRESLSVAAALVSPMMGGVWARRT